MARRRAAAVEMPPIPAESQRIPSDYTPESAETGMSEDHYDPIDDDALEQPGSAYGYTPPGDGYGGGFVSRPADVGVPNLPNLRQIAGLNAQTTQLKVALMEEGRAKDLGIIGAEASEFDLIRKFRAAFPAGLGVRLQLMPIGMSGAPTGEAFYRDIHPQHEALRAAPAGYGAPGQWSNGGGGASAGGMHPGAFAEFSRLLGDMQKQHAAELAEMRRALAEQQQATRSMLEKTTEQRLAMAQLSSDSSTELFSKVLDGSQAQGQIQAQTMASQVAMLTQQMQASAAANLAQMQGMMEAQRTAAETRLKDERQRAEQDRKDREAEADRRFRESESRREAEARRAEESAKSERRRDRDHQAVMLQLMQARQDAGDPLGILLGLSGQIEKFQPLIDIGKELLGGNKQEGLASIIGSTVGDLAKTAIEMKKIELQAVIEAGEEDLIDPAMQPVMLPGAPQAQIEGPAPEEPEAPQAPGRPKSKLSPAVLKPARQAIRAMCSKIASSDQGAWPDIIIGGITSVPQAINYIREISIQAALIEGGLDHTKVNQVILAINDDGRVPKDIPRYSLS